MARMDDDFTAGGDDEGPVRARHGEKLSGVPKIIVTAGDERGGRFNDELVPEALLAWQRARSQVDDVLRDGDFARVFVNGAMDDLVVHGGFVGQLTRVVAWLKY